MDKTSSATCVNSIVHQLAPAIGMWNFHHLLGAINKDECHIAHSCDGATFHERVMIVLRMTALYFS